jgi:hypothetical protein
MFLKSLSITYTVFFVHSKAFSPMLSNTRTFNVQHQLFMSSPSDPENVGEEKVVVLDKAVESTPEESSTPTPAVAEKAKGKEKMEKKYPDGVFTPLVQVAKKILGEGRLKEVRAKTILIHTDVINSFIETASTPFGQATLEKMFEIADKNGDGTIDDDEMSAALDSLGFSWLSDKQVSAVIKRADKDKNGVIDVQEFKDGAPKTLKANLTKLAKKNGTDLGLMS